MARLLALGFTTSISTIGSIMHHASAMGMMSAIRSGLGIAVLPCIVADADPDLIQCVPPKDGHGRTMWLVTA